MVDAHADNGTCSTHADLGQDVLSHGPAAPVQPGDRIATLDMLRGFAIFGILLVNMEFFNQSVYHYVTGTKAPTSLPDQLARWFTALLAEGKFYSIFSFLFGVGMALQWTRAEQGGTRFAGFWLRRMIVLLGFGLIHAYLIWSGDILIMYSVLGISLLLWRKARPRTLLVWAVILLMIPLLLNAGLTGLVKLGEAVAGADEMNGQFAQNVADYVRRAEQADQVYAAGGFWEITAQRVRDMNFMYGIWPFMMFNVLAMMVLGLSVGKSRLIRDIAGYRPFLRRVCWWGLVVGLVGNFVYVYCGERSVRMIPSGMGLLSTAGQIVGAPALAIFYMASLALAAERVVWRRRLNWLAQVGRMALSNYLLQSLVCATLFFGSGFGLYGTFGIAGGVLVTICVYALNVLISSCWLRHFRFGPMEWVWRSLSYGRWQPIRASSEGLPHGAP
ncbi:MAG: DUF418 domain-containing protein [Planctomycetes bacterium]|nr:DUF418 domain-containing protein [Planctomycetota bacterium]